MAPSKSTTLRVPAELRDEIARLAERRGVSMVDVVSDAVHRLGRDEWWDAVHEVLDGLGDEEADAYLIETERLDGTTADNL